MDLQLKKDILQLNPWLEDSSHPITRDKEFISRVQVSQLLEEEWDTLWTLLIGPRRAGKTTIGKYLAKQLLEAKRYEKLLYLNCDYLSIRRWLSSPQFIKEAMETFHLKCPILFIDEVQRIENPGLLLKAVIDLELPIKHIATGSSQLEIKSKVQEHLTGRQLSSLILPLSHQEWGLEKSLEEVLIFGCYPQVLKSKHKEIELREIYNRYIQKDIVEILKVGDPDVFQSLITLIAHSTGQLVNYQQLATDSRVSATMIRNHLDILEQTFVLEKVTPFVGNKRSEITKNPIYYFIDNGFRNVSLRNFNTLNARTDVEFLFENFVFQEIHKFRSQQYLSFDIHYWRTRSGAKVDFILYKNNAAFLPIEVKYQGLPKPTISRGFRSFIEAYRPKQALMITRETLHKLDIDGCTVHFIPLTDLSSIFEVISQSIV